jgi:RimJ/RimL family protein N-acetyltransferase
MDVHGDSFADVRRIPDAIETARLRGELPGPQHLDGWHALMSHDDVVATMWPGRLGGARTRAQILEIINRDARHREQWGLSPWAVVLPDGGDSIGRIGLAPTRIEEKHEIELAWMLHPDHWGRGYVTEIARESVRIAFGDLGLEHLVALTLTHNERSENVMKALGMTYDREVTHAGLPHVVYTLRPA